MRIAFPLRRSSSTLTGRRYAADRHGSARPRAWDDSSRRPAVRPARSPRPRQLRRQRCCGATARCVPAHWKRSAGAERVRGRRGSGSLAIGPQITLGQGPIRLYGFATAGGSLFWSNASYSGGCGCYASNDFYLDGDFTTTTSAGTGVLIQVASRRSSVAIDLGVRGVRHDRVMYVPAGGLTQNSDGTFSAQRVETPVELRVFQIGVSIGIR